MIYVTKKYNQAYDIIEQKYSALKLHVLLQVNLVI